MKRIFFIISLFSLLLSACSKQELADEGYPKVAYVSFTGQTSVPLDLMYEGELIDPLTVGKYYLLPIEGESGKLELWEQESKKVIFTKEITQSENFSLYYDGTTVYEKYVLFTITGYALSGTLEFVVNGTVMGEGSLSINQYLDIFMNEGEDYELVIRLQGETATLTTIPIDADQSEQSLRIFFDGTEIIDEIPELPVPSEPENMVISATFNPSFADYPFNGDAEVDLVFYVRTAYSNGTVIDSLRVTVPTDGSFVNFELPPLPDGYNDPLYTFDVCKKGSEDVPYDFTSAIRTVRRSRGAFDEMIFSDGSHFIPGGSELLVLGPRISSAGSGSSRYYVFYGTISTNLSRYFK